MSTNNSNKPVSELRDGSLKIAIFRNESKEDTNKVRYSGKLTRSYKDASGNWHDTDYLSGTEFLRAARLLEKAYDEGIALRAGGPDHDTLDNDS